jgi:hypothetical protein
MLFGKLEPNDTYKTIIMGDEGQGGEPINLTGEILDKLNRFRPIGFAQNSTTIFRADGTVEVYGMIPFKEEIK